MRLRKLMVAGTAVTLLVGVVTATTAGVAGASPASSTRPTNATAAAAPLAADALVSKTGRVITPTAAAAMAGTRAGVTVHNGYAPTKTAAHATDLKHGTGGALSIIGTDNRFQITPTTSYPNSAIVLIRLNGGLFCTGYMVGADTLLSAGHCVTDGHGTWFSGLTFTPGSDGGNAPFGTCTARAIYAFSAWAYNADGNYDTSIIKLACTVGKSTGWFGTWWQSASPNGLFSRVQGYPGDRPSTQWESYDYIRDSSTDRLYYQNDTVGGESGSPVWQYRYNASWCNGACSMGVHTNGSDGTNNSGVRFTQGKLNAIYAIVNAA